MTNLIDSYLLFRLKTKRDPEAFARIYDRYVKAIYRFVIIKLPSQEEAQDVTAETFTRTWQYVNENKKISNIRALLYRIARNLVADRYRKPENLKINKAVTFEDGETSNIKQSDDESSKRVVEARADLALILQKLERLKEDYRDVLTLRLIDDLPFGVIAEILEKDAGHVRVIYHRALKALKDTEHRALNTEHPE